MAVASALFALEVLGELAGAFYFLAEPASLEAAAAFAISHDIVLTNFSLISYVMVKKSENICIFDLITY